MILSFIVDFHKQLQPFYTQILPYAFFNELKLATELADFKQKIINFGSLNVDLLLRRQILVVKVNFDVWNSYVPSVPQQVNRPGRHNHVLRVGKHSLLNLFLMF